MLKAMTGLFAVLTAGVMATNPAAAQTYTFKTDNLSKKAQTILYGINNSDMIVGNTVDLTGATQCYLLTGHTKTAITDPAAPTSSCTGINSAGAIAGSYPSGSFSNGFVYANGVFSDIVVPAATAGTVAYGINDAGEVSGYYADDAGSHGFVFDGTSYQTYNLPGQASTLVGDINNSGQFTAQGLNAGVVTSYLVTSGVAVQLAIPGAVTTLAEGLNNAGIVALVYFDSSGNRHGGAYNSKKGKYTFPIDDPGQPGTSVLSVNDHQTLTGRFVDNSGASNGFIARGRLK